MYIWKYFSYKVHVNIGYLRMELISIVHSTTFFCNFAPLRFSKSYQCKHVGIYANPILSSGCHCITDPPKPIHPIQPSLSPFDLSPFPYIGWLGCWVKSLMPPCVKFVCTPKIWLLFYMMLSIEIIVRIWILGS